MLKLIHPLILLFFSLCSFTCNTNNYQTLATKTEASELPTRQELFRTYREKRQVLIVYGAQEAAFTSHYKKIAERIQANAEYLEIEIKSDEEISPFDINQSILLLLGSPQTNKVVRKMIKKLPLELHAASLTFNGENFTDSTTVLSLPFYPNPLKPGMPMIFMTSFNDDAIINLLENNFQNKRSFFGWSFWGYELFQHNKRILLGFFNEQSWELDKKTHFDFTRSDVAGKPSTHYEFIVHNYTPDKSSLEELVGNCERSMESILGFTGYSGSIPKIGYHLYASAEEKGLMLNNTDHSHVDFGANEVHTVLNATYKDNFIGAENKLILRHILGKPRTEALETGLAIYFTTHWQYKGYDYWAMKLFKSANITPLTELFDNELFSKGSDLVLGSLSASFVAFLIEHWEKEGFLEKYAKWEPSDGEIGKLEQSWHRYLEQKSKNYAFEEPLPKAIPFLKGFNFAHEGYAIYNGYISKNATRALEKLAGMSANAVAIIPYSYIPDPQSPSYIGIAGSPGSENDESVVHSAFMAKKLGFTTMLKPQIWMGRNSWPGDVEMQSEEEWQQFFRHYHRWILHYALLAEIQQMDLFCLGTEFVKTTLSHEREWRNIIGKIKGLFSGKLTYAANWGEEFEKLTFWDELDYIGFNCYYPLSAKSDPTAQELKEGFKMALQKAEKVCRRYQKPLIFTEIGFRSIEAPWRKPHAGNRDDPFNAEHQKLCYQIVFEGIKDKDWCKGILWWKFPAHPEYGGLENKGFTPNKKPSEKVVEKWFGKMPN